MTRQSLVGPVLLIALGLLLLARNFWPEFSVYRLFAAHWPWLLIVWGVFRLFEYALARLRSQPAPQPLGAGALVAAILLVLAGSIAHGTEDRTLRFRRWRDRVFKLQLVWPHAPPRGQLLSAQPRIPAPLDTRPSARHYGNL